MDTLISVVVPVFNSYNSLDELYKRLDNTLRENFDEYEIIMVDDHSQDNSYQKLKKYNKKDNRIKIIKLSRNFGQQNALFCGFHHCSGDYIVTIDDDLQHSPHDILRLYDEIKKGYDIVYGIFEQRQQLFYRRIGSYLTDKVFNMITDKRKDIRVSSFRILKKELLKKIIQDKRSFIYLSAIILNETPNISNIEVEHNERKYGNSNYSFIKLFKLFLKLYIYYSNNKICKLFRTDKPQFMIEEKAGFKKRSLKMR